MLQCLRYSAVLVACAMWQLASAQESPRYNQMQQIKAHNAYHAAPDTRLTDLVEVAFGADEALLPLLQGAQYTHPSLTDLLSIYNVRSLEIDVFDDPEGGRFAYPAGDLFLGKLTEGVAPEMLEPGFKVLHVDHIDFESTCTTLTKCLAHVTEWAAANPDHDPVTLTIELVDEGVRAKVDPSMLNILNGIMKQGADNLTGKPVPTEVTDIPLATTDTVQRLHTQLVDTLGIENIVTPDSLRKGGTSLQEVLLASPETFWPTIEEMRGKFVIVMLGHHEQMVELYGPQLAGSPAFTRQLTTVPGTVPTDIVFLEEPVGTRTDVIREKVEQGYMVLTFADKNTIEARNNDTSVLEGTRAAGAHLISTDFARVSDVFPSTYTAQFDSFATFRCNPVTADASCTDILGTEPPAPAAPAVEAEAADSPEASPPPSTDGAPTGSALSVLSVLLAGFASLTILAW